MKSLTLLSAGLVALLLAGCNSETVKTAEAEQAKVYTAQFAHSKNTSNSSAIVTKIPVQSSRDTTLLDRVVWNAEKQKGKMYRYGGESPKTGFDCSGLTQFAFEQGAGVSLPRTAADQYAASVKIPKHEASKGDLVFFKTSGKRISHVGIYLGMRNLFMPHVLARRLQRINCKATGLISSWVLGVFRVLVSLLIPNCSSKKDRLNSGLFHLDDCYYGKLFSQLATTAVSASPFSL
ncbi:C40 family peptidase [Thiothrix subterranea]|uniref:C40 family peptidase n=1 Tax=Thiothrix subterranea TaxID=2735563 RepID=UPI00280B5423|nr:C40 family peptidase [Thiothrix subterranea]